MVDKKQYSKNVGTTFLQVFLSGWIKLQQPSPHFEKVDPPPMLAI